MAEKLEYKVIDEGGAAILQNDPADAQNLAKGALVMLDPENEETISMLENKTIALSDSDEAKAVEVDPAKADETTEQNGQPTDSVTGEPVDPAEPKGEDDIQATDPSAPADPVDPAADEPAQ